METYRTRIEAELASPQIEMTKVLLEEGYKPQLVDGRVVIHYADELRRFVLVPLIGKDYYLRFQFDSADELNILSTDTAPYINIFLNFCRSCIGDSTIKLLQATSPTVSDTDIKFQCDSKELFFSSKLEQFLLYLEQDADAIYELVKSSGEGTIWVVLSFDGSYPFSGLDLSSPCVRLLDKMGLTLVFDIYTS